MNIYKCDVCGDEYQPKAEGGGLVHLAIVAPGAKLRPSDNAILEAIGMPPGAPREEVYKFDLCHECSLAMALALKHKKADARAGRRSV